MGFARKRRENGDAAGGIKGRTLAEGSLREHSCCTLLRSGIVVYRRIGLSGAHRHQYIVRRSGKRDLFSQYVITAKSDGPTELIQVSVINDQSSRNRPIGPPCFSSPYTEMSGKVRSLMRLIDRSKTASTNDVDTLRDTNIKHPISFNVAIYYYASEH